MAETDDAPRVRARGLSGVGEQALAIAAAHGSAARNDAEAARTLASLDLDSPIPPEVLVTVAEIISYICRADRRAPEAPERAAATPGTAP